MQISNGEALVLGSRTLQEADVIVDFLTREGKRSGVARGARKKFSRYAGQLQLLAKVRLEWVEKPSSSLVRIGEVSTLRAADGLHQDLESIMASSYLADTLQQFAQEREENDHLFRLLDSVTEQLLAGVDRNLALRYFECWVLRISGLFPPPIECPLCNRPLEHAHLAAAGSALICAECAETEGTGTGGARTGGAATGGAATGGATTGGSGTLGEVSASTVEFLLRISRESLEQMGRRPPPGPGVLTAVERLCRTVRRSFLQDEIRSYRVMRQTLGRHSSESWEDGQ